MKVFKTEANGQITSISIWSARTERNKSKAKTNSFDIFLILDH